ncbi:hypothetical protein OHB39_17140 [Streptomyces sp. NBC_00047]|uniref:hypothetical protein n=1 Tax=Streptomyces sp. NBC_00047 TaxID=2975627 RepID=UPI002257796A|nr:hypothetical protein [Streptomyces sp. NBC_00047]MCX5609289.1 hypothetical protein [Streptomyces sp. NBC_00047]
MSGRTRWGAASTVRRHRCTVLAVRACLVRAAELGQFMGEGDEGHPVVGHIFGERGLGEQGLGERGAGVAAVPADRVAQDIRRFRVVAHLAEFDAQFHQRRGEFEIG